MVIHLQSFMAQKKCGAAVFRITTGTAKRRIEIQINKAVRTLAGIRTTLLYPFLYYGWQGCPDNQTKLAVLS